MRGGAGVAIREEAIRRPIDPRSLTRLGRQEGVLPSTTQAIRSVSQTNNITNHITVSTDNPEELVNGMLVAMDNAKVKQKLTKLITGNNQERIF